MVRQSIQSFDIPLYHWSKSQNKFPAHEIDFTKCDSSNKIARAFFMLPHAGGINYLNGAGANTQLCFTLKAGSKIVQILEADLTTYGLSQVGDLQKFLINYPTQAFQIVGGIDHRLYYAILDPSCLV